MTDHSKRHAGSRSHVMKNEVEKPRHSGQGAITDHSDLIERLRHADQHSQQRMLGSGIFGEAASALSSQSLSLSEARAERDELKKELLAAQGQADEHYHRLLDAQREIESHSGTLRFCEAEWSKERGVMIDKFVFERTRADRAEQVLRECQSALAMMIAPDAIKQTTVINAYATAVAAEAKARSVLENGPAVLADAHTNPSSPHCGKGVAAGPAVSEGGRGHSAPVTSGAEVVGEAAAYDFVAGWHERQAKLFREMAEDDPRTAKPARDRAKEAAVHHAASAAALRNRASDDRRAALVSGSREEQS